MKFALKTLLTVVIAWWITVSGAQGAQDMEIIALRSQSVEQVLPVLMPLLEPGGTLTGMDNQLFLRASPRNRAEIKRALMAIDRPAKGLIIRISHHRESEIADRGAAAGGHIALGATRQGGATVWESGGTRRDRAGQLVRTVDGGQAFIQVGRSLPIPMRQIVIGPGGAIVNETTVYRDIGQGFYVAPRLNGDRVTLNISQQADSQAGRGQIETQRLSTTVVGRLGEWIALGGSGRQLVDEQRGVTRFSTADGRDEQTIWLMVEVVE